jgi:23S rRNA (cytosine1962-C5)-methyltransferase
MYSMGFSPIIMENLIKGHFNNPQQFEIGEVVLPAKSGVNLPLGILARFSNV